MSCKCESSNLKVADPPIEKPVWSNYANLVMYTVKCEQNEWIGIKWVLGCEKHAGM